MAHRVEAWLHASDFLFDAWFLIEEWLEQATDRELLELNCAGWTGEPATKVSDWFHPKLKRVQSVYGYTRYNEGVTDVTEIDPNAGRRWIQENRPHLVDELEDDDEST